ncbi:MAG: TIGR00725 family protein [Candidatus Bathyarchaeia archaeon]
MRPQILVIGFSGNHCTAKAFELAYEVGKEIAKQKAVLITGGLGGVMEGASKGAHEEEGLVVSIIPHDEKPKANKYSDIIISTGMGQARNFVTAYSADAVIIVGGGVGTIIEACVAYFKSKTIVAIRGSGEVADRLADTYLDDRKLVKILGVDNPKEAVMAALRASSSDDQKSNT